MAVIFTEKIILQFQSYPVTVYHRQGDTDEKIVFLHGGGVDSAMMSWKEVMNLMDSHYDLYAVDLLGYGESGKPDIEYSIPLYVELLHSVLEQLGIEHTSLAGLSMGGGVCLGFSLKYPQMVSRLILTDSLGLYERMPLHSLCRWFVLAAAKVISNSRVHIMKGCRHWVQKERPEEYVKVLADFLGQKPESPC